MAVQIQYRAKYECDLESELNLAWGEGTIAYCKENGGKWWKIESNSWIVKTVENPIPLPDWSNIQNKPSTYTSTTHSHPQSEITNLVSDLSNKSATSHTHAGVYEPANSNIQTHVISAHAPSNAQKNSNILKSEIEAVFTGNITTHTHNLNNYSTTDQTINAGSSALLTGSLITIPSTLLQIGTIFRYTFSLSKTAAGTAANTFFFRVGTNGTVADSALLTFTLPIGTAVVDVGFVEILITIRGPLSGACIAQGVLKMVHNLAATGLSTLPCVIITNTSSTFNATTASLKASLSCTTAASTVLTFQQIVAETINL